MDMLDSFDAEIYVPSIKSLSSIDIVLKVRYYIYIYIYNYFIIIYFIIKFINFILFNLYKMI